MDERARLSTTISFDEYWCRGRKSCTLGARRKWFNGEFDFAWNSGGDEISSARAGRQGRLDAGAGGAGREIKLNNSDPLKDVDGEAVVDQDDCTTV